MILQDEISVRDLVESDLSGILNYWHKSSEKFLEGMGVDLKKMPSESEMKERLQQTVLKLSLDVEFKSPVLSITYKDKAIGVHSLFPLEVGESAIFHAHILDEKMRGKGIAKISYLKACKVFMERFELNKILFKTPVQNIGAIKVKESLGIKCIGEEEISFGIIKSGTKARVFELKKEDSLLSARNNTQ